MDFVLNKPVNQAAVQRNVGSCTEVMAIHVYACIILRRTWLLLQWVATCYKQYIVTVRIYVKRKGSPDMGKPFL
jgi:hypothetical protein